MSYENRALSVIALSGIYRYQLTFTPHLRVLQKLIIFIKMNLLEFVRLRLIRNIPTKPTIILQ